MAIRQKKPVLRFDAQHRASIDFRPRMIDFINRIEREEIRLGVRRRARRKNDRKCFWIALEALSCNLLLTHLSAPGATLSIPRAHSSIWGKSRYRDEVYGQHFLTAVDLLRSLHFIRIRSRGYRFSKTARQLTTIVPTKKFQKIFGARKVDWKAFTQAVSREPLILKASKDHEGLSGLIQYSESSHTSRLRMEVVKLNEWIREASLTVTNHRFGIMLLDDMDQPIAPWRRDLRRIFNNGSWQEGGRLFGGFWMTMERAERFKSIRIADEQIVNVDFSALFPRLAYFHANKREPKGDPYDIIGDGSCREGWKKLFNALLFTKRPLKQWPRKTRELFPSSVSLRDAIWAIKDRHAPIIGNFEIGIGFHLMKIESDLLLEILSALVKQKIIALPLHDSVLVARSQGITVKKVMEKLYRRRTSRRAIVKIDHGSSSPKRLTPPLKGENPRG